jgi:asparagine synthase (glutamine-hydrolysing)
LSDFLIHFNNVPLDKRKVVTSMRYFDDMHVYEYDYKNFSLFLSRADDVDIWGPYEPHDGNLLIALAGRVAFDGNDWEAAKDVPGRGGLACKAIYKKYLSGGIGELEKLNGNFVVLVVDAGKSVVYIITDRCGMFPCYCLAVNQRPHVIGSHPDIIAAETNQPQDWDFVSIAEFLMTGKVSFPHSYYNRIKALDSGSIHEVRFSEGNVLRLSSKKYFEFNFNIDHNISEWDLAEELASAFRKAVNRRTLPQFGHTGISLSGGLDSRTLLCSADDRSNISAFSFYDEENPEFRIAKQIAQKAGVKFIPLKRAFDHYADSAEMGVRISGGMGNFGNNHYLGFRSSLSENGIKNILTGCYCDYFFKTLALDIHLNKYTRIEKLSKYQDAYYHEHLSFDTPYAGQAGERLNAIFSEEQRNDLSAVGYLKRQARRTFPILREADNMQRLIPQRVMPWYLPIVDNDIVDVYLKIPPQYKLNTSLFSKMASMQCGEAIAKIPNANTGLRVNASLASLTVSLYKRALLRRLKAKQRGMTTEGSWPNWGYYIEHSRKIDTLWKRGSDKYFDLFKQILGEDPFEKPISAYTRSGAKFSLFLRVLTLKLWFEQRDHTYN